MNYQLGAGTGNPAAARACSDCHDLTGTHFNSGGKRLLAGYDNNQANTNCNQCHPPGTVAVADPVFYVDSDLYEAYLHSGKLCTDCHEVHGAAANADPAMARDGGRALCLGCHYAGNPEGATVPTDRCEHVDDLVACTKCHNPHRYMHPDIPSETCSDCHVVHGPPCPE